MSEELNLLGAAVNLAQGRPRRAQFEDSVRLMLLNTAQMLTEGDPDLTRAYKPHMPPAGVAGRFSLVIQTWVKRVDGGTAKTQMRVWFETDGTTVTPIDLDRQSKRLGLMMEHEATAGNN
ncbi:MAG: hypothetical protein ABIP75_05555 [Pyrinomonadaceae bacterium]